MCTKLTSSSSDNDALFYLFNIREHRLADSISSNIAPRVNVQMCIEKAVQQTSQEPSPIPRYHRVVCHRRAVTIRYDTIRQRFSNFFLPRTPILLKHSWRTPTLITVKFTAKYWNSWAHCFLQANQHHQLYTNYNGLNGKQTMLVWWMCLLRFAQTVNSWSNVG